MVRRKNLNNDIQVLGQTPEGRAAPWMLTPLVNVRLREQDSAGPYAPGITLRYGAGPQLRFVEQRLERDDERTEIVTVLRTEGALAYECEHRAWHFEGESGLRVATVFRNVSAAPLTLQLLTTFSLGGLTPFAPDDAPERLWLHRSRSWWSGEGRMESTPFEALHLERAWGTSTLRVERFGQVGSLPVRKFFPFAAVEDRGAGVVWAAQLAAPGSWQIEVGRRGDTVELCGGLADREFGHWMKTIAPGEAFTTDEALLTVAAGDVDRACHRLTALHKRARLAQPASERELPIVCNEWCTSWGNPSHDNMVAMARRLHGTPVKYLVIDAGWYRPDAGDWGASQGDWLVSAKLYPHGLKATTDAIRAEGLVPGIWFEFETVGTDSAASKNQTAHLLQLDGRPLTAGTRRFWDFRDPWVTEYLTQRVIAFLREHGFGYMKVDYNESIGLGADGTESLGETLRAHLAGVQNFFRAIRTALPDVVIESCASGGHRLEPSFLQLCPLASSSDAHECLEVPILSAEQLTQLLPEQNLIWAVVRRADDERRLAYTLAACFLGRLCLSGDIHDLSDERWAFMLTGLALYREAVPAIRDGAIRRQGERSPSHRHPRGWQAVTFSTPGMVLVVIHTFADAPTELSVAMPPAEWSVAKAFPAALANHGEIRDGSLRLRGLGDFAGQVLILRAPGAAA
ncbi:MAG: alpha-galactosidase [Opitutaceae bacterium]|nr:alpha-galactosidase [Opitutaceae bacterium]